MEVVLFEPEIPQNAGNIVRSCALSRSGLHLIRPLGFSLEDRYLKRAGLDYWEYADIKVWDRLEDFLAARAGKRVWVATTHAAQAYSQARFAADDILLFGRESSGLPPWVRDRLPENHIRIPMLPIGRSLNLSNAVAIVLFEALRQQGFPGLE
ncbi:MAG: tRNA (cytidine(34)-2'-O)-methyltransferase [Syntrophomonadaceae bacterium]|nr:tRNA (cytidine(34)-2'-O)-methyltransferase [Syntrophomonadaceae bacterium]